MNHIVLAAGLCLAAVLSIAGPAVGWAGVASSYVYETVLPAGAIVAYPNAPLAVFTVPPGGATFLGSAHLDHSSISLGVVRAGAAISCSMIPSNWTYEGPPWNYTVHQHLAGGLYLFGDICDGFANLTVTQPFEVVVP